MEEAESKSVSPVPKVYDDSNAKAIPNIICQHCSAMVASSKILAMDLTVDREEIFECIERFDFASPTPGCHLCTLLEAGLSDLYIDKPSGDSPKTQLELRSSCGPKWKTVYLYSCRYEGENAKQMSRYVLNMEPHSEHISQPYPEFPPAVLSKYTGSDATFDLASRWLAQCSKSHSACHKKDDTHFLPTRLIEIDLSQNIARIVLSANLPKETKYTTLSHCWGGRDDVIRLVLENESTLMEGIKIDSLPQSFQDAMITTRKLGLEHIWIDSMCIIQDSKDDWSREATGMCDVYRYSELTIAALSAKDSFGGCFTNRNPLSYLTCKLEHPTLPGYYYSIYSDPGWRYSQHEYKTPLYDRAWVLQERLLSRRVLYFGATLVSWECSDVEIDELGGCPSREIEPNNKHRKMKLQLDQLLSKAQSGDLADLQGFYSIWRRILTAYTSCKLTQVNDKLIAISGIIQEIRRRTQFSPVAGLWKEHLLQDLLWTTSGAFREKEAYRAPSWSWASVDAQVNVEELKIKSGATLHWKLDILDVNAEYKRNDQGESLGELTSGVLNVEGYFCTLPQNHVKLSDGYWEPQVGAKNLLVVTAEDESKEITWGCGLIVVPSTETGFWVRWGVFRVNDESWDPQINEKVSLKII